MPAAITAEAVLALLDEHAIVEAEEPLAADTDLFACGLDSLALMRLIVAAEQAFGRRLPPAEITRARCATAVALAAWLDSLPVEAPVS
jgi:acyl carrier protein